MTAAWNPGLRVPTQKFWHWLYNGGQKIVRSGNGPSKFKVKP